MDQKLSQPSPQWDLRARRAPSLRLTRKEPPGASPLGHRTLPPLTSVKHMLSSLEPLAFRPCSCGREGTSKDGLGLRLSSVRHSDEAPQSRACQPLWAHEAQGPSAKHQPLPQAPPWHPQRLGPASSTLLKERALTLLSILISR